MTTIQILKKARAKISKPDRWAKGDFAFDKDGNLVIAKAPRAACWCAAGAVCAVSPGWNEEQDALVALDAALPRRNVSIADYNDAPRRTHAQILALFDRAIARLKAKKAKKGARK